MDDPFCRAAGRNARQPARPESPAIRLVRTEPGRQAALRFSGLASAGVVRERSAALLSALDAAGRTPAGPVVVYYYDDPFTLPWRRRNEVAVPIAD
ncbi:MAG: heme-binding protein [Rhodobacteraceae bacterium]|nr:heme-binding protein [Paracoccaceae bacterium]